MIDTEAFDVNGKKYVPIERERTNPTMSRMMLMAMAFSSIDPLSHIKTREAPNVNLIEEFSLIQQKKSKLSRSDREWVINQFNRNFKEL